MTLGSMEITHIVNMELEAVSYTLDIFCDSDNRGTHSLTLSICSLKYRVDVYGMRG